MKKIVGVFLVLLALLFVAPVLESGSSTQLFQAIGTADGGDGSGDS